MSDQEENQTSMEEELAEQTSWLTKNLYKFMIWTSIIWFGVILFYITQFFGWSNLFLMMPDEFGGFLAGVTLPLAILWVVVAYIDRGTSFKNEAKLLRAYMNQLVYPEEGGAQTAKAIADGIRSQVIDLQNATKTAMGQSDDIKKALEERIADFSKLVSVLDKYSSQSIQELSGTIKQLSHTFDDMNQKAISNGAQFKEIADNINNLFGSLNNASNNFMTNILPNINEIRYSAELLEKVSKESNDKLISANETILDMTEKSQDNIEKAAEILLSQALKIENISQKAIKDCDNLRGNIDNSISEIADVMQKQNETMQGYIANLSNNADSLSVKFGAQSDVVKEEIDKIISRASVAEESIQIQVRALSSVAEDISGTMQNIESKIKEHSDNLQKISELAVSNTNTVIDTLQKGAATVAENADKSILNISAVTDTINESEDKLQEKSKEARTNTRKIS